MTMDESTRRLRASGEAPVGRGGVVLGRYRLERRLGAGGHGVVWLGFDERLEREVAVKVVPREAGDPAQARAIREARVAARLNHPGIVSLYELGEDDEAVYLVSELVPGRTLAELIQAGAVSDRDVARIGVALCDALSHAHARGVIHRDVKPPNVIVVTDPAAGAGFAKLADFGVAHLAVADPLTGTGDVVGTLAYMAPEQAEGERATEAADVYALGLTLYEAWSGVNPVRGATPAATVRSLGQRLPSLGEQRPDLPREVLGWVDSAVGPEPARRPRLASLRAALADVAPRLPDTRGLADAETARRVGLTTTTRSRPPEQTAEERERSGAGGGATAVASRAGAGLAAGVLVLAGLTALGPAPRFSAVAAAAAAGLIVAILPRVGWLACAGAFLGWLGWELRDGTALVVLSALAPVPMLLPYAGRSWSLPALAPLLGAIALGPAYLAVAGSASTPARRLALGATGFLWTAVAELLTSNTLLLGPPPDAAARSVWAGSPSTAGREALAPLATSPAVAGVALWAALAALLPVLVRRRSAALDIAGAAAWGALLIAGHEILSRAAHGGLAHGGGRGLVFGSLLGALAALAASRTGLLRRLPPPPRRTPHVPTMAR